MKSKTSKFILVLCGLHLILGSPAIAREKSKNKSAEAGKITAAPTETAPAETENSSAPKKIAVGVASADRLTGGTALTGIIEMDPKNMVQGYLAVPGSSPFQFSLGGVFKHTIAEQGQAGLHVGGGASLGIAARSLAAIAASSVAAALGANTNSSSTDFFFAFGGVAGVHVPFPGVSNVMMHFDAGPIVHIQSGANDFTIGALSGLLGASVFYYF